MFNSVAKQSTSAKKITSEIASAFFRNDFESVVAFFSKHLQSEAIPFLCDMHRQVSAKMTIPQKKCPGDSFAESGDWIAKRDRAACIVDVATLQAFPFAGSCLCELAAEPKRNKRSSVSFHTAFTKTAEGLRVAAIEVKWEVPIERKRRRSRITNGPPCPECGEPLATELAKQCMHCGANL